MNMIEELLKLLIYFRICFVFQFILQIFLLTKISLISFEKERYNTIVRKKCLITQRRIQKFHIGTQYT